MHQKMQNETILFSVWAVAKNLCCRHQAISLLLPPYVQIQKIHFTYSHMHCSNPARYCLHFTSG